MSNDPTQPTKSGNLAKFTPFTPDAAAKEREEAKAAKKTYFEFAVGKTAIRILPAGPGQKSPFVVVYQHYVSGPDGKRYVFVCPRVHEKKRCPGCEAAQKLKTSRNTADIERGKDLEAKRTTFAAIIDRKAPELGPRIAKLSVSVHEKLLEIAEDPNLGGDFTDPYRGFDIIVTRTGTGRNDTRYSTAPSRATTPLGTDEQIDLWLASLPNFSALVETRSLEDIQAILRGEPPQRHGERGAPAGSGAPITGKVAGTSAQDELEQGGAAPEDDDIPF